MNLSDYREVSLAPDQATLQRRLVEAANEMDFGLISGFVAVKTGDASSLHCSFGNVPEAYLDTYIDPSAGRKDPVLCRLKRNATPFTYDQQTYVNADARDLYDVQSQFGYRNGVAVGLHTPNGGRFILGVDREQPLPTSEKKITQLLAEIQLLAVFAADKAIELYFEHVTKREAECPLSPRELECLRWTMAGKSVGVIGDILNLSSQTVSNYIRSANHKAGCSNKHSSVLKALRLGWITP